MGKAKGFWGTTSQVSEEKIKVILKYVKSKKNNNIREEEAVRMSTLHDSFISFKNGDTLNSTFEKHQEDSLTSKSDKFDNSINEATNENLLFVSQLSKNHQKKKEILVKVIVEELDSFSEQSTNNMSQDSLENISGVQLLQKSDVEIPAKKIVGKEDTVFERHNISIQEKFERIKENLLIPTDVNYYSPQINKKTDDEKIAEIIKELVLKKFKQNRNNRKHNAKEEISLNKDKCSTLVPENDFKLCEKNDKKLSNSSKIEEERNKSDNERENYLNSEFYSLDSLREMAKMFPSQKANNMASIANIFSPEHKSKNESDAYYNLVTPNSSSGLESNSCYFTCEPKNNERVVTEQALSSANLNETFVKENPTTHRGDNKMTKRSIFNTAYYTSEELGSSCSSQGVYDCCTKTVLDKENVSCYFEKIKRINENSKSRSVSYEEICYDEHTFLKEALGSNMELTCSDASVSIPKSSQREEPIYDRSIDTDNISTLISSESCAPRRFNNRKLKRNINSVNTFTSILTETSYDDLVYEAKYVPVCNSAESQHDSGVSTAVGVKKPSRKSLPNVARNEIFKQQKTAYPLYEDVIFADKSYNDQDQIKEAQDDLIKRITQQKTMVEQAERILSLGSKQRNFYGGTAHLEAERIRLVSTVRKDLLEKQLIEESYKMSTTKEAVLAKLVIKNVSCTSSISYSKKPSKKQYFIGIFQNETTVLCTTYAEPNMFGDVEFQGQFTFDDLNSDFKIKFSLYTLAVRKNTVKNKLNCFNKTLGQGNNSKYLELIGTHKLEKSSAGVKKPMKFENCRDYSASYKFSADSILYVKPLEPLKNVLTVGSEIKGYPVWNSRWCVLEGTNIKCFLFPSDEFYGKPLTNLDLKYCQSCEVDQNISKMFRSSALKLTFFSKENRESYNKYLIADDVKQLYEWQKHILMAIQFTKLW